MLHACTPKLGLVHVPGLLGLLALVACGSVSREGDGGTTPGAQGATCTANADCTSDLCVDGRCCNDTCSGQCEACDVAGKEGTCAPVTGAPHGDRAACEGSGACAGACDGQMIDACTMPTGQCRAESCFGSEHTLPATCTAGACPDMVTETCPVTCGATACVTALQVAAGYYNTCVLMSDKTVRCFGQDSGGQLGNPATDGVLPAPVVGVTGAVSITTANSHACALLEDGTAMCWGSNYYGELGRGSKDNDPHREAMPVLDEKGLAPLANIQQIVTGQFRTCALVKVGNTNEARCWGLNTSGALGNGGTAAESTLPTPVCLTGSVGANSCVAAGNLAEIATGDSHTCARFNGGAMACWGANFIGQLGLVAGGAFTKDNLAHPNPVFVKDPANVAANLQVNRIATAIGETGDSTCAIRKSDQAVLCWGTNFKGQLGRNSLTTTLAGQETPSPVCASNMGCPPLTGVSDLGVGYGHACAIVADKVRCWGWNNRGQLGDQTFTDKAFAGFEVPTAERASQVAVGEFHTCARLLDGRVQCWGIGGSLGSGETDDVPTPTFPKW